MVHEVGFERSYAVGIINFKIADIGDGAKDIPNMAHLHSPSVVSRLRLNLHVSKVIDYHNHRIHKPHQHSYAHLQTSAPT